jgi:hypothetical protein
MKISVAVIMSCLTLLAGCNSAMMHPVDRGCPHPCTGSYRDDCRCLDPACAHSTTCLDSRKCCRNFGNVGGY